MANIKVGIKFRPLLANESSEKLQWIVEGRRMKSTNGKHNLVFDNVFDENASTEKVYKVLARPVVSKALQGYNGTIIAYGQTSSGKTFSMIGSDEKPGIIPMTVEHVFNEIKDVEDRKFLVRISYIEIYNDKIYDLFDRRRIGLNVFEVEGNVVIKQKVFVVKTKEEVSKHFRIGNKNKRMVETANNALSSRSHTIFRITVESQNISDGGDAKISNLFLVDLAGSEKPELSKKTFQEGLHINKSLLALGKIIRELSKKKSNIKHASFRECKLTRILSPALGGNSLTSVICTVSPSVLEETYRTICFAQNAKRAKTYPTFNSATKNSMMKCVRFDSSPQILDSSLKRRNSSTPIGSQTELCPQKKVKIVQPKRKTIIYQHKVLQSLKIDIGIENVQKKSFAGVYVRAQKVEKNEQKEVNDSVKASETYSIEDFNATETVVVEGKNDTIQDLELLETMYEEKLAVVEAENESLRKEIQLFEKAIFDKENELKSMERRMYEAEQETTEIKKNYDEKFSELRYELGSLVEERNETVRTLESQVSDAVKQVNEKKIVDLNNYIQLEKHFDTQIEKLSKSLFEVKQKYENGLQEKELEFKKTIEEKDLIIMNLKLAQSLEVNKSNLKLTNRNRTLAKQINDLSVSVCESIKNMSDLNAKAVDETFISRVGKIFQEIQRLMKKLEILIKEDNLKGMAFAPSLSVSSPPSESGFEQSPGSIKGGTCPHCMKSFTRKAALDRHMLIKHPSKEQNFECAVCNEIFKTKSTLNRHTRKAHHDHA